MLSLNTIMIHSEDPARLVGVYREVLGEPGFEGHGYTGWKTGSGYFMVGAHSEVKGPNEMPGRIMVNFETPDVAAEFVRLTEAGMTVVAEPYQPGDGEDDLWLATVADPDGNFIQLASPMPED